MTHNKINYETDTEKYILDYDDTNNSLIEYRYILTGDGWLLAASCVMPGSVDGNANVKFTPDTVDRYVKHAEMRGFIPVFHHAVGIFRYKAELDNRKHLITQQEYDDLLIKYPKLYDEPLQSPTVTDGTSVPLIFAATSTCDGDGNIISCKIHVNYQDVAWWNANDVPTTDINTIDVGDDIKQLIREQFGVTR